VELTDDSKDSSPASSSSSAGSGNGSSDGVEPSANQVENGNGNNSDPTDNRAMHVLDDLWRNRGVNESDAWDSAAWAVSTYPEMTDISQLADNAYAKYLDERCSRSTKRDNFRWSLQASKENFADSFFLHSFVFYCCYCEVETIQSR
jgi:hypothetical protein